jgi:hypothetical protein
MPLLLGIMGILGLMEIFCKYHSFINLELMGELNFSDFIYPKEHQK